MSLFAKIMVVVNFILAVCFLAAAGTLLGAAEDYKKKWQDDTAKAAENLKLEQDNVSARDLAIGKLKEEKSEIDKDRTSKDAKVTELSSINDNLKKAHDE